MTLILSNLLRMFTIKILKSRAFWMAIIILILSIVLIFNATSFFFKYHMLSKINNVAHAAQTGLNSIDEIYKDALAEEGLEPDSLFGEEVPDDLDWGEVIYEDIGTGNDGQGTYIPGSSSDPSYSGVVNEAEAIEGGSVLHQLNNAIVRAASQVEANWFNYSYIIGINMKEANGFGGSWIPHIGADKRGISSPDFDINTWGINDITTFSDVNRVYNYTGGSPKQYIGPFQTGTSYYFGSGNKYTYSWSQDKFKELVASSGANVDGNGDGKSDPFNYLDALEALKKHSEVKYSETKNYFSVINPQFEDDIMQMSILARYVGVSNSQGTKRFGSENGPWTGYTHHEHLNPHIQLMRKAAEEYYGNKPHFQRFKQHLQGSKSLNGADIQSIINGFYNDNGWTASGNTGADNAVATYTFPDGKTMKFKGQNVHYVFLAYWGGKVAEEEIQKALQ